MLVKVWDKKESINGIEASDVIASHAIKENDEIFLVLSNTGRVLEIQFKDIIIDNYNLDANLTCREVADQYLNIKMQEDIKNTGENYIITRQSEKINSLEKNVANLEYILMTGGLI